MQKTAFEKYTDPVNPGSFSGLTGFSKNNKIAFNKIQKALLKSKTYTLHKPKRLNYLRNKVIVSGIDEQWQIDLVDVKKLKGSNFEYSYILTCIDSLSKFGWAIPIKDKEAL